MHHGLSVDLHPFVGFKDEVFQLIPDSVSLYIYSVQTLQLTFLLLLSKPSCGLTCT